MKKNEIIAKEITERKELWSAVRRAEPIQQIRRIMRHKQILNKDLAERLGVTEASISRLLRGQQNLQLDTLYQLADALEESLTITVGQSEESMEILCSSDSTTEITMATVYLEECSNVIKLDAFRTLKNPDKPETITRATYAGCSVNF